ncbi:ABC transporter ATP-binding protein [Microbacterium sp. Root166]|uniref:ABC transporter ATP-binding protein n=1 Tax=Microbacterium sp. Root166 TaxID=1736478 RepID=UPI000AC490FB|nr:ABC transporter ATP-binding protein [Microbacterium sp. Root166]
MTAGLRNDTPASTTTVGDVILDVRHLTTVFTAGENPVTAVDDVSITARFGQTLGVVGESGSGKSVLARSIMGLVSPGTRVERTGEIVFDGTDLASLPRKKMRRMWGSEIAMVLQDPLTSLNPVKKIGAQVIETVRRHHPKLSTRQAGARGVELLRSVGIPEPERRMKVYPHQMSGGMRQRVGIAISLAGNPRLLFADEPTTALDVTVQMQILDLLAAQQRERQMTMVLVTHDLGVVATRTDHIVVMYAGQVVESAPTRSLFTDVKMPYTRALLDALPKLDQPSHTRLKAIPGHPPNLAAPPAGCRFAARCPAAQDKCRTVAPPLIASQDDAQHLYRCWFPVGTPEYEAARAETEARAAAKDEEIAAAAAVAHQLIEEPA